MQFELSICAAPPPNEGRTPESPPQLTRRAPEHRLPELYYLHNFRRALRSLRARYADLLSSEEAGFIEQFSALPERSQCLLARMLMRKGPTFRRTTLDYPEVDDLQAALEELSAIGWLELQPEFGFDAVSRLLSREEWRRCFGRLPNRSAPSGDQEQLGLPLPELQTATRRLSGWHRQLRDTHIQLLIEPTARHLQWLYFGNDRQSWAEFVMSDLGLQRYESVPDDTSSRAFSQRSEIEHFYRLLECRSRLREGLPAASLVGAARVPEDAAQWLRARFARLQLQLGETLEKQGEQELAMSAYRGSMGAQARIRIVRLLERQGLHAEARAEAGAAIELECSEAERQAILRRLTRLRRRLNEPVATAPPRRKPPMLQLTLAEPPEHQRVEIQVRNVLSTPECPVFYVENGLFPSLFGLLFWDAIFAPLPGAFFHPFQSGPADLHTPDFLPRRKASFDAQMTLLDCAGHEEAIWQKYRDKAGIHSPFVHWGKLREDILSLALRCIPATHMKLIFERLLTDLAYHCTGLPDLVQFRPADRTYQLVEVKGPGDRLQHNQRSWLDFFGTHDIPAAVCQVSWQGASSSVRKSS